MWHTPPVADPSSFLRPQERPRAPLTRTRSAEPLVSTHVPSQNPGTSQFYDDYVDVYEPEYAQPLVQSPLLSRAIAPIGESIATGHQWRFPEPSIPLLSPRSPSHEHQTGHLYPGNTYTHRGVSPPLGIDHRHAGSPERSRAHSSSSSQQAGVRPLLHSRRSSTSISCHPPGPMVPSGLTEQEYVYRRRRVQLTDFSPRQQQELLQDGIKKFQDGMLPESDCEWHRLVSTEFRDTLPKNEVQRQSIIFEVIKSEKDYVNDVSSDLRTSISDCFKLLLNVSSKLSLRYTIALHYSSFLAQ